METKTDPKCFARHTGLWAVEPHWLGLTLQAWRHGLLPLRQSIETTSSTPGWAIADEQSGIVEVVISGQLTKGESKFGGVDSVQLRKQLRQLGSMSEVQGIILRIDSPGGTVAGTADLADDVHALSKAKPIWAFIEDLGASAAYWIAAQATRVSATETSEIGSIGTIAVVYDSSGQATAEGVRVHVLSTGEFKGAGVDGTEVTPAQLSYFQDRVDEANGFFLKALQRGREVAPSAVKSWADGRVWGANEAKRMGLIDKVESYVQAIDGLKKEVTKKRWSKQGRITSALLEIHNAETYGCSVHTGQPPSLRLECVESVES
jgi:signal peptide peptidase SppA